MSAVPEQLPGEIVLDLPVDHESRDEPAGLPRAARLYLLALAIVTLAAAGKFYLHAPSIKHDWMTFVVLAAAATVAQVFPVKSPRNLMYHTSVVFLVAAALLLPPELIVLIPLVQTIPEWLKERYPWPIQVFNISNYTLDGLAAWGAAHLVEAHGSGIVANGNARFALAGLAASVMFVATNHILVAVILKLGRNHTVRETGLFTAESISIDLVLTILGVSLAAFWHWNPWLIFAAPRAARRRMHARRAAVPRHRRVAVLRRPGVPASRAPSGRRRGPRPAHRTGDPHQYPALSRPARHSEPAGNDRRGNAALLCPWWGRLLATRIPASALCAGHRRRRHARWRGPRPWGADRHAQRRRPGRPVGRGGGARPRTYRLAASALPWAPCSWPWRWWRQASSFLSRCSCSG